MLLAFLLLFSNKISAKDKCNVLNIGGNGNWRPVGYVDENTGNLVGISYDLVDQVGKRLNIPIGEKVTLPWKRLLKTAQTGELDIVAAAYKPPQRQSQFHFSVPYHFNEARIFTPKNKVFRYNTFEDLFGKVGIKPAGGSYGKAFDEFSKNNESLFINITTVQNSFEYYYVTPILKGLADYFILDGQDGLLNLKKHQLEAQFVMLDPAISRLDIHLMLSQRSKCVHLLPKINQVINEMKSDGSLSRIIKRYQLPRQN